MYGENERCQVTTVLVLIHKKEGDRGIALLGEGCKDIGEEDMQRITILYRRNDW